MSIIVSEADSFIEVSSMTLIPNPNPKYEYNPTLHIVGERKSFDLDDHEAVGIFDQLIDFYSQEPISKFTTTIIVTGVKKSSGYFEGRSYDSTKVYIQLDFDKNCDASGAYIVELNWGASNNFSKLAPVQFPFEAVASFEQVLSSEHKSLKLVLADIQIKSV